ncbi:MAG: hypothetical protein H7Y00_14510 [Fimbriimonadaceae bacterium]|nr:hypothetical protein [Chitinophagales bacterium]
MKKLILKFLLLLIIVLAISQVAINTMPFTWGNQRLNTKFNEYSKAPEQYNAVLVGASTTYRHINPSQFDSAVNAIRPDLNIKSFNFGIPANRTPQSVYTLYELMNFKKDNIKYVVLDLSELTKMGVENLHKKEMIFWYNWNNIDDILEASYESEKSWGNKIGVPGLHLFSFFEKIYLIGMGSSFVEQHAGKNLQPLSIGTGKNGFYSLDQEMQEDPEGDLAQRYEVLRRQDTIDYRTKRCQELWDKYHTAEKNPNKTIEDNLKELIKYCEANDIKIVFMLSQRLGDRYQYLLPLINQIPEKYQISFANPSEYPMLNERENLFDLAHLNSGGAKIFTDIFAKEFIERINMQEGRQTPPAITQDTNSIIQDTLSVDAAL